MGWLCSQATDWFLSRALARSLALWPSSLRPFGATHASAFGGFMGLTLSGELSRNLKQSFRLPSEQSESGREAHARWTGAARSAEGRRPPLASWRHSISALSWETAALSSPIVGGRNSAPHVERPSWRQVLSNWSRHSSLLSHFLKTEAVGVVYSRDHAQGGGGGLQTDAGLALALGCGADRGHILRLSSQPANAGWSASKLALHLSCRRGTAARGLPQLAHSHTLATETDLRPGKRAKGEGRASGKAATLAWRATSPSQTRLATARRRRRPTCSANDVSIRHHHLRWRRSHWGLCNERVLSQRERESWSCRLQWARGSQSERAAGRVQQTRHPRRL